MNIHEYNIVQPPTSREVRVAGFESMADRTTLDLVVAPIQELPEPESTGLSMLIRIALDNQDGSTRFSGTDRHGIGAFTVQTQPDFEDPASLTVVYPDTQPELPALPLLYD